MASLTQTLFILFPPVNTEDRKTSDTTINVQEIVNPPIEENGLYSSPAFPVGRAKPDLENHKYLSPFISERAINEPGPLKVIYIGAGISGILAAIKFRKAVPSLDLILYEKDPELGGTGYENKYPGCACGKQNEIHPAGKITRKLLMSYSCTIPLLSTEF